MPCPAAREGCDGWRGGGGGSHRYCHVRGNQGRPAGHHKRRAPYLFNAGPSLCAPTAVVDGALDYAQEPCIIYLMGDSFSAR